MPIRMLARNAVVFFRERFRAAGTPARAAGEKAYLKSALNFHGVDAATIRRACADFCRAHPDLSVAQIRSIVEALYETDFHDLRSAGVGLLERRRALLTARDLPWLVHLVRRSGNWAHVDWLATAIIGRIVPTAPRLLDRVDRWALDRDFWVRRTALLAQLGALRAGGGDFPRFAAIAAPMLVEKEFFIRKAIGWVLREVAKKRPELTFGFLREHGARASGLTMREGAKYLPPAMRAQLATTASARTNRPPAALPPPERLAPRTGATRRALSQGRLRTLAARATRG
jgi:3-methyladenine DNA glycosylase AlkD